MNPRAGVNVPTTPTFLRLPRSSVFQGFLGLVFRSRRSRAITGAPRPAAFAGLGSDYGDHGDSFQLPLRR